MVNGAGTYIIGILFDFDFGFIQRTFNWLCDYEYLELHYVLAASKTKQEISISWILKDVN